MKDHTAYLSIGSNMGDKQAHLDQAVSILKQHNDIDLEEVSHFYKTEPQNFTDQDWFINAAVKIRTGLSAEHLLLALKTIEKEMDVSGKPFRFGPRKIDLDIIYYDDLVFKNEQIEVPHPRMHERCFVLVPLCDIGAEKKHPVLKAGPDELLKKIEAKETQKVIQINKET